MKIVWYLLIYCFLSTKAFSEEVSVEVTLRDHIFSPDEIHIPKDKKIVLLINNMDSTVEEFDSPSLKREKILRSNSVTKVVLGQLSAGKYEFVGEFHAETAKGVLIVDEK